MYSDLATKPSPSPPLCWQIHRRLAVPMPLLRVWVHCPRASNGSLPPRSHLVGYVRWDAQSDRYLLCQTIIPTAFRSQNGKPTIRPRCLEGVRVTYSVPSTERLLNAKHFSRLPPKSVARQEALWQDTLHEGSVRALCQGGEYNSSGLTCHLKEAVRVRNSIAGP